MSRSLSCGAVLALAFALASGAVSAQGPRATLFGAEAEHEPLVTVLGSATPRRFRPVGTTSVTLRVDLGRGREAAFKPRSRVHARGHLAEIAAYRIARQLGLEGVPPAVGRVLPRPLLQERVELEHPDDWEPMRAAILWDAPGLARGAMIHWVPNLTRTELDRPEGFSQWASWVSIDGELPETRVAIARDLSQMIAFDYLIGNWDRFSGGNVSTTPDGQRLFVRDHNVAFATLTPARYARVRGHLERVQRFSRSFVRRLESLDEDRLREALARDPLADLGPILTDVEIEGVMVRRRALSSYVGALVALHGAEQVLFFD